MLNDRLVFNESEKNSLLELLDRLCQTCDPSKKLYRDALMFSLMLYTGARSCEIVGNDNLPGIRPCDLLSNGFVLITSGKKRGKIHQRSLPIPEGIMNRLREYVAANHLGAQDRLFPMCTAQLRKRWMAIKPVDKSSKTIRHTFATALFIQSGNLKQVQQALGHSSILNTQVYMDYVTGRQNLRENLKFMYARNLDLDEDDVA